MPHLPSIGWDHNDQMQEVGLGGGGTTYSTYDAAGQRVRKVWEHSGLVEERIYLDGWEVYRKRDSLGKLLVERETLHGMDGTRRVVRVETKTVDITANGAFSVVSRNRFQLNNHLGSASLELDASGLVIGYEEYHPYGTTAYSSGRNGVEVSGKRYRYTGKERDEESGLYYHGARYLAPWLGRWTSADPKGMVDGANQFSYVRQSPTRLTDPSGTDSKPPVTEPWNRPPPPPAEVKKVQTAIENAVLLAREADELAQEAAKLRKDMTAQAAVGMAIAKQAAEANDDQETAQLVQDALASSNLVVKLGTDARLKDGESATKFEHSVEARQKAIDLVIEAYHIDTSAAASVKYSKTEDVEGLLGHVRGDQEVKIGSGAFRSPGFLASIVSHEAELHSKQARAGIRFGPEGSVASTLAEIAAYDWNIGNAKRFGLSKTEAEHFKDKRKEYYGSLPGDYQKRVDKGIMTLF